MYILNIHVFYIIYKYPVFSWCLGVVKIFTKCTRKSSGGSILYSKAVRYSQNFKILAFPIWGNNACGKQNKGIGVG